MAVMTAAASSLPRQGEAIDPNIFLSIPAAAKVAGYSIQHVYNLTYRHVIPVYGRPGAYRVRLADVLPLLDMRTRKHNPNIDRAQSKRQELRLLQRAAKEAASIALQQAKQGG